MTQIFAHRGYSASFPENTMKAFLEAEKAGADGIELDVQLTKDGEIVVIHDETVNRTTNGTGFVKDFLYKDLNKLDVKNKKGIKERIPSLIEVFDWLKTNQLLCNIELKNGFFPYEGMEEKVIALTEGYGFNKRIIISSFNHYSIVRSHRLAPGIETAPLFSEQIFMPWIYAQSIKAKGIHPQHSAISDQAVIDSMKNGIAVRPYTVNKQSDLLRFFKLDCSAIITDQPAQAIRLRNLHKKRP